MRIDSAGGSNAAARTLRDDDPSQPPQPDIAPTPPAAPSVTLRRMADDPSVQRYRPLPSPAQLPPATGPAQAVNSPVGVTPANNETPTIGPADGVWVTDYDRPLPSNVLPHGPYVPHRVTVLPGDAARFQTGWTGDVGAPPDSVLHPEPLIDGRRQYQFRISGAEFDGSPDKVRVVEKDGEFYASRFYNYTIEQRDAVTFTARNPTGPGVIAPNEYVFPNRPSDWKPSSYAEISELRQDNPAAFAGVWPTSPFSSSQINDEYLTSVFPLR